VPTPNLVPVTGASAATRTAPPTPAAPPSNAHSVAIKPNSHRLGHPVQASTASSGRRLRTDAATALATNTVPSSSTSTVISRVFRSIAEEISSAAPIRDHISLSASRGRPYFPAGSMTVTAAGDDPWVMSTSSPVRW
jgi:hypothetical protein